MSLKMWTMRVKKKLKRYNIMLTRKELRKAKMIVKRTHLRKERNYNEGNLDY